MIHIELKTNQKPAQNWFDLVQNYDDALKNQHRNFTVTTPTGRNPQVVDLSTPNGRNIFFARLRTARPIKEALWSETSINLKGLFFEDRNLVGHKCWLAETKAIGSFLTIEHFRPKNETINLDYVAKGVFDKNTWEILASPIDAQITKSEGYYWLTYDWKNYRLSCQISNTRKGNYFPLFQNSTPATQYGEEVNEFPVLIDPLIKEDIDLIYFEKTSKDEVDIVPTVALPIINGIIEANSITKNDIIRYFRAVVSIWVYSLNEMPELRIARGKIWNDTEKLLKKIKDNTPTDSSIFAEIQEKTDKLSEYCGVARQVVKEYYLSGKITEKQYNSCFSENSQ